MRVFFGESCFGKYAGKKKKKRKRKGTCVPERLQPNNRPPDVNLGFVEKESDL